MTNAIRYIFPFDASLYLVLHNIYEKLKFFVLQTVTDTALISFSVQKTKEHKLASDRQLLNGNYIYQKVQHLFVSKCFCFI